MERKAFICLVYAALLCLFSGCAAYQTTLADAEEYVSLPIVMYHSVLRDEARAGMYVVSPDTLRGDLLYLKDKGYETMVMQDLAAYTRGTGDLPDKPVMITLDDGYYNNLTYVLPILEELDMCAVISVVGTYTQAFSDTPDPNPNYGHLSWEDIRALHASGRVEIQNHSYDMHSQEGRSGSKRKSGEPEAAYRNAFCSDTRRLQEAIWENCGLTPSAYTYPYGQISVETAAYLREMGFLGSLTCYERCNRITRDPECLFGLGRYNRPAGISRAEFMEKLLKDA